MENFIRNLKRGIDKYKGMLPLKCFNCGKIGHFANKFPYVKKSDSDEEEDPKKEKKYKKGKSLRKISTQENTIPHPMKMMKETMIPERYYLWIRKIRKEPPMVPKKKNKSIS